MNGKYKPEEISEWIKKKALELGFSACGIARADNLQREAIGLRERLSKGYNGEMAYLAQYTEKRNDPRVLLVGARSVISVLLNYYPTENLPFDNNYRFARYALGRDYHEVIREKLDILIEDLRLKASPPSPPGPLFRTECSGREPGTFKARSFIDSAPVFEKPWAQRAGLGYPGKNSLLINPTLGSFVFIGEIITDLELEYDQPFEKDLCGRCTRCLDACPTGALVGPRELDARKCIAYLTIEYQGELPEPEKQKFGDWIFGCDICQEVCPWNGFARPSEIEAFRPSEALKAMNKEKWNALTREVFQSLFKGSAVKRTKFEGLRRNIDFLNSESKDQ